MKLVHVVQHTSAEFLGLIEDHLEGRGIRFRYYRPFAGKGSLPRADSIGDGLILLGGGPWGSAGTRNVPTLDGEIALARACLDRDCPVIGIGLGAQIVALATGGRSETAELAFEVTTARRSHEDALNGYLPAEFPVALYMRDWPVPPDQATVLARDPMDRPMLWQAGKRTFGFAGHPGIKVAMVEDLIMEFEESPKNQRIEFEKLRMVQRDIENALVPIMTGVVQLAQWM